MAALSTRASTLSVSAPIAASYCRTTKASHRRCALEDSVFADVTLNVYVLEQLPSSRAHYDELRRLNEASWLRALHLKLSDADGRAMSLHPRSFRAKCASVGLPPRARSTATPTSKRSSWAAIIQWRVRAVVARRLLVQRQVQTTSAGKDNLRPIHR